MPFRWWTAEQFHKTVITAAPQTASATVPLLQMSCACSSRARAPAASSPWKKRRAVSGWRFYRSIVERRIPHKDDRRCAGASRLIAAHVRGLESSTRSGISFDAALTVRSSLSFTFSSAVSNLSTYAGRQSGALCPQSIDVEFAPSGRHDEEGHHHFDDSASISGASPPPRTSRQSGRTAGISLLRTFAAKHWPQGKCRLHGWVAVACRARCKRGRPKPWFRVAGLKSSANPNVSPVS